MWNLLSKKHEKSGSPLKYILLKFKIYINNFNNVIYGKSSLLMKGQLNLKYEIFAPTDKNI